MSTWSFPSRPGGQKSRDVDEYGIDVFVIGDDWIGTFDEQLEGRCEIAYLPRTPEIGSAQMRPCDEGREVIQEALAQ